jgi:hypothetical protein
MRKISILITLLLSACFLACQKQSTEEERRAEVERQVQERLAAEHQQQQAQELAQREASVKAREQALNEPETAATATPEARAPEFTASNASTTTAGESSYATFYTRLEPYGDWIETGDYGYVFRPHEAENNRWRPYTDGRWVYTEAGWTWVSNESFGWATYHYGRWTRLRGIGWVWAPGNEWAPAWVSWRKGGQYVGWAPLPPEANFDRASGIRNWSDNYYDVGPDQYCFVPTADFGEARVEQVIVPAQQNVTIINQTTNVTNITYNNTVIVNQGPSYDEMRAQSRAPIQRLRLQREAILPGENVRALVRGDTVSIPAPAIVPRRGGERPRAVKQTIKQAAVDRGWEAVSNQREAEQARAKMRSEATAPPNAPPKKFVKPASVPVLPAASPAVPFKATTSPVRGATAAPAASVRPAQTPAVTPVRSASASLRPNPTTAPSVTAHPHLSPPPTNTPLATAPSSSPLINTPPPPSHSPAVVRPPNVRRGPPPRVSPPVSTSPSQPAESRTPTPPSPTVTDTQLSGVQRRGEKKRQLPRREKAAEATASPSPAP